MKKLNKKVIVAMSGGVDSSVSAALLKKQGYEVIGVHLKLTNKSQCKTSRNEYLTDEQSARKVAKILKIPFRVIDARKGFKSEVIDYMLREFQAGRTPNPCVVCNPKIKFATLLKLADKLKAVYIATGHYCKVKSQKSKVKSQLFEATDKTKDQSYFLYGLSQKQLARVIFPLGNYKKTEVKNLARKMKLPVYDRQESHDVCFISGKLEDYLRNNLRLIKGNIVDSKGKILGEHQGLPLYTIGQRKGINLGGPGPYYVIGKDFSNNNLIITNKEKDSKLFSKLMEVEKVNWINKPARFPLRVYIRIRYGHPAVRGIIKSRINTNLKTNKREYYIRFDKAQRAITPEQAAVFYAKDREVLGGGLII